MNSTSPTTVMAGIFAILFGLAAAYGVRQAMTPPPAPEVKEEPAPAAPAPAPIPMRSVIMAKENIAPFTTITKKNVSEVLISVDELKKMQDDAERNGKLGPIVTNINTVLNRVAKTQIMAGTRITEGTLYEFGNVPTLEDKLQPGELAMSIPVSEMASVAGFLHPEARVNISWLPADKVHPDLPANMAACIYKNVRVLATSADMNEYNPGTPRKIENITIAVTQKMADALNVLQQKGVFNIVMCTSDNGEMSEGSVEERATIYNVLGLDAPEEDWNATATTDAWQGTAKQVHEFNSKEVLEATNATRVVMNNLKPLKKMPKRSMDPDTVIIE